MVKSKWTFVNFAQDWVELLDPRHLERFLGLASDQGWTNLRFRDLKLREFPEGVIRIRGLTGLDLSYNDDLHCLPESISSLVSVQHLDFSNTGLKTLPNSFGTLVNLKNLSLSNTALTELPESFGDLINLSGLNFFNSGLTKLPESFGNLRNLQVLDLSFTGLTALPDSFGNLGELRVLLGFNLHLTALPESFGNLVNLQSLYFSSTNLAALPDSFGSLVKMQRLSLYGSGLIEMPESLANLVNLEIFSFSNAELASLPEFLGSLVKLTSLDLSFSRLLELPEFLGKLVDLERLLLSGTGLTTLPGCLVQLVKLKTLDLSLTRLTELPEFLGQLVNLETLNLAGTGLTELPEFLGQLVNLKSLNLAGTGLTELPEFLGQLVNLESLNLTGTGLTELPEFLGQLVNLEHLNLSGTGLTELPEFLGTLVNLKNLSLAGTGLTELPEFFGQLVNLEILNLSGLGLEALPECVGNLVKLENLDLCDTGLVALPASIENLVKLKNLNLSGTRLVGLPTCIGNLVKLESLDLSGIEMAELPQCIGNLAKLENLNLSRTGLSALPEFLANLVKLRTLNLSGTKLTVLPEFLGNLVKLTSLNLSHTKLTRLPDSLRSLASLTQLEVSDLALGVPPEICTSKDAQRILALYYDKNKLELSEAKLILVGQGGVGKTSLVNRLLDGTFNALEKKTEGISINHWLVPILSQEKAQSQKEVRLNVWDFGGQEVMHATHQFFLTKRSMYILVWDARQEDESGRLDYWLELIRSYGGSSPVLVVMNKSDTGATADIDQAALLRRYQSNIRDRGHFFSVSCKTGQGVEELKLKIAELLTSLGHVWDEWPSAWFNIKKKLEKRQENTPYITYKQYAAIAVNEGVTDQRAQADLIDFLHDLGIVLCFRNDNRLDGNAVLDPHWVTEGVYAVINSELVRENGGEFDSKELPAILDSTRYPLKDQDYILEMMKKFELCFKLADDRHLIPELLSQEEPERLCSVFTAPITSVQSSSQDMPEKTKMVYAFKYNVLPGSVITRFIVRMHRYINGMARWRNGVVLQFRELRVRAMVRADRADRRLDIFLDTPSGGGWRQAALAVILFHLHTIHKSIGSLKAEGKIPFKFNGKEILLDHKHLQVLYEHKISEFIPEGYTKPVEVKPFLESVEISSWKEVLRIRKLCNDNNKIDQENKAVDSTLGMFQSSRDSIKSITAWNYAKLLLPKLSEKQILLESNLPGTLSKDQTSESMFEEQHKLTTVPRLKKPRTPKVVTDGMKGLEKKRGYSKLLSIPQSLYEFPLSTKISKSRTDDQFFMFDMDQFVLDNGLVSSLDLPDLPYSPTFLHYTRK